MGMRYNTGSMSVPGHKLIQRGVLLSLVLTLVFGVVVAALVPFMQNQAYAAGTAVNLPERGKKINLRENRDIAFGTCEPYWSKVVKTRQLLQTHFYPKMDDLPYESKDNPADEWDWLVNEYDERTIESRIGSDFGDQQAFSDDEGKINRAARMLQQMGTQEIPVIRFRPAPQGIPPLDGNYSANGSVCDSYVMLPVDYPAPGSNPPKAVSWRSMEVLNEEIGANNPDRARGEYMEFRLSGSSNNLGTLDYWGKTNGGELLQRFSGKSFFVDGTYPGSTSDGSTPHVGTINAAWVDAATININNSRQNFAGEVYKKRSWNTRVVNNTAYSYYFLDTASPGREDLAWGSNSKKCEDALPLSSACGGEGICVPFIAVKQKLNVDYGDNNLSRLQNDINQLGGAQAELYDFTSSCVPDARYTIALSDRENAKIWLYYSSSQKALTPAFTTGDSNEVKYVGIYGESKTPVVGPPSVQRSGEYKLGECIATIVGNPLMIVNDKFGANWTLTDGNCSNPRTYGTISVMVRGGAAGETAFNAAQEEAQSTNDAGEGEAKFVCNLTTGPLNWIFCPITRLVLEGIDALEAIINRVLTLNVDRVFNPKFHTAWEGFRTLALALIAIAALIMVISQAAGVEILDAYTIKKVLPRLLFAAIAITVSWAAMKFLVTLSNDAGEGIRYLIYSPFEGVTELGGLGFTGLLVGIVSGGAFLALGVLGMLSFAATALLAAAVAFGVIIFRELLVMFLVITAPFAIACYILPNTQKLWELWKNAFIAALMVFVIITTFIAIGRVFAIITIQSGGPGDSETLAQIIAFVAYILPYFLITTAFRMAGGVMSVVGGMVNDRTKGGFDRLRNFRSDRMEQRGKAWKEGRLYDNDSIFMKPGENTFRGRLANRINKAGSRANVGLKGRYGVGARGQFAMANAAKMHQMENEKDAALTAASLQDDDVMFALASGNTEDQVRAAVTARWGNTVQAQRALEGARALGISHINQGVMMDKLTKNKARAIDAGDTQWIERAALNYAEGNQQLYGKAMQDMQYNLRTNGRGDLGGTWHAAPDKVAEWAQKFQSSGDFAGPAVDFTYTDASGQQQTISGQFSQAAIDAAKQQVATDNGVSRIGLQQYIAGHPNAVKSLQATANRAFKYGSTKDREQAALQLLEASKGLSAGMISGDSRDAVVDLLNQNGIPLGATEQSAAEILAKRVGTDPLDPTGQRAYTAQMLTARGRVYDMAAEAGARQNPDAGS